MNRVDPRNLSVRDLRDELRELEESWTETLLRGSEDALDDFASRTRELEEEFDRRQGVADPIAAGGAAAEDTAATETTAGDEAPGRTATGEELSAGAASEEWPPGWRSPFERHSGEPAWGNGTARS
ncbi:hypothetical protein GCM10022226_67750 [Sphaerisporangium flaviroseum]|uniref:Uncharacterized protein n=1 Tax=Sphaerisporangium flaviroseum TaxID=509199 RepID=A0ABP7J8B2_9ACTN